MVSKPKTLGRKAFRSKAISQGEDFGLKVMVLGADGYLGRPLSLHLLRLGHEVIGVDYLSRRRRVREVGGRSAISLGNPYIWYNRVNALHGGRFDWRIADLLDGEEVEYLFEYYKPDAVVHLAEQPSAPYSQMDRKHAVDTQTNNTIGTLNVLFAIKKYAPDCHLVKLGTMGEWGTPNVDIPEGKFEIKYRGRKDTLPFPKQAGSFYHLTKVFDSHNITYTCRTWGLRSTDIMQGVVYGVVTDDMKVEGSIDMYEPALLTRFDFDQYFGTSLNRFCAQAVIDFPLTIYGSGEQKRGFIALRDSIQCITIALNNPPEKGEYRVWNQFDECYSILELASLVQRVGSEFGMDVKIKAIPNPRVEASKHWYNPVREQLPAHGFKPTHTIEEELRITLPILMKNKDRIESRRHVILPSTDWREAK